MNTGIDGKLEFYVPKIVTKGYSLKLCFNYGKPFQQWSYSNPLLITTQKVLFHSL